MPAYQSRSKKWEDRALSGLVALIGIFGTACTHLPPEDTVSSKKIEWRIIDKAEREAYLSTAYNPASCDRATFRSEWYSVYSEMKQYLESEWVYGVGDGDFFIDSDCPSDRSMDISITNERMIDSHAVAMVQNILRRHQVDYSADLCNGWVFLRTQDGEPYPEFNIVVEKDRVSVYSESKAVLDRLGLTMK